ncbi:MAG TPA: DEAD/DEAH box helicase [Solirubrobacteraceae bacterium]|nr:DEAD/DEAH box helicase [Solirubrobacteraceae bacterium]
MTGEVRLRPDREGVEIVADGDAHELALQLRRTRPELRLRPSRGRLHVGFTQAEELLPFDALRWAPDAARALGNRRRVRERVREVGTAAKTIRETSSRDLRQRLGDRPLVGMLDDHQVRNVALMTIPSSWGACIFDEQGTGKTPTVIAAFDLLAERNEVDTLLVVAPKSMVGEWAQEFSRFCGDLYRVSVVDGSRKQRAEALGAGADVVVVNYEATVTMHHDLLLLTDRSRVLMAVDESFNVKNPDAARTAAVADLRERCSHCFVLCGTPAPNAPRDIVAQVSLVDFGMTFDGLTLNDDPEHDRGAIREALGGRGLFTRNLKQEVLPGLPDRRFSEVTVEFAPEQQRLYARALDGLILDLERTDDETYRREQLSFAERRSALLRLCSHPSGVVAGYRELPGKILALDGLLEQQVGAGEKLVLWSFYRATLDILAERYARFGIARIDGSIPDVGERRDAVRRFQEDDETFVFLGNPAAAGAGLTLHRAALAIYESFSNQAAHFMQSLDRIHRRGQESDVEYLVLLCRDSVEEAEYKRILSKVDLQADLLGDPEPYRPTRDVLLDELLAGRKRLGV